MCVKCCDNEIPMERYAEWDKCSIDIYYNATRDGLYNLSLDSFCDNKVCH